MLEIPGKDRWLSCLFLSVVSPADLEDTLERSVGFAVVLWLFSTVTKQFLLVLLIPQNYNQQNQTKIQKKTDFFFFNQMGSECCNISECSNESLFTLTERTVLEQSHSFTLPFCTRRCVFIKPHTKNDLGVFPAPHSEGAEEASLSKLHLPTWSIPQQGISFQAPAWNEQAQFHCNEVFKNLMFSRSAELKSAEAETFPLCYILKKQNQMLLGIKRYS